MKTITVKCKKCGKNKSITRILQGNGQYAYFASHKHKII